MTELRFAKIIHNSVVDGPGLRSVLFFQGCTLGCPGCQSPHLWPARGGQGAPVEAIAGRLLAEARAAQLTEAPALTLSGGEPFQQPEALAELVKRLRQGGAGHLMVYSGYTYEEILTGVPGARDILARLDVLVDGRYDWRQDAPWLQYRGSKNQRPIDVPATLKTGGQPVVLDWDRPEIIIDPQGNYLGTGPVIALLEGLGLGPGTTARRCGQSR